MIYGFADFELDTDRMELRQSGQRVGLEPQVFALLCLLVENRERMVSKDEILEKIWDGRVVSESALTSRIKSLRRAVGDDGQSQRVIRTVRGHGFRFVASLSAAPARAVPAAANAGDPGRPSVAVLPFFWVGPDDPRAIVAKALPHELIAALCRLRWLAVIARGSTFRFRGDEADIVTIGAALGARYCVTGVAGLQCDRIVVSVDLVDGASGHMLMSERVDFDLVGVHAVRGDLVARIVAALELEISRNEALRASVSASESLDAWAEYHLGLQAMYRFNNRDNAAATIHFERAVGLDPGFARAYAGLSFTSFQDAFLRYANDMAKAQRLALEFAEKSIELDPHDPFANFVMGRSFFLTGDAAAGIEWLERSTLLSPNFAQGLYSLGWAKILAGRGVAGRPDIDAAMRLSPLDPLKYAMLGSRALTHIEQGEYAEAVAWAERAATAPGSHVLLGMIAAVAQTLAGNDERAAVWAGNVRRRRPDIGREAFFHGFPFVDTRMRQLFDDALSRHDF